MRVSEKTRKKALAIYPYITWVCIILFSSFAAVSAAKVIYESVNGRFDPLQSIIVVAFVYMTYIEIRYDFLDGLAKWKKERGTNDERKS